MKASLTALLPDLDPARCLVASLLAFTVPPSPYPTLSHCSQMAYLPLEWDLALFKIHFSTRGFLLCKCLFSLFGDFLHGLRAADVTRQKLHRPLLPVFLLALGGGTCALVVSRGLLHRSVHYSSLSISGIDVSHFNKSYHAVTANSLGLAGLPLERIFKILETGCFLAFFCSVISKLVEAGHSDTAAFGSKHTIWEILIIGCSW